MKRVALALVLLLLASACMDMDAFLANEETLTDYSLPGNTIPGDLIEPVEFDSEGHTLHGFWVDSGREIPVASVIYFHGNKHHIDEYWDRVMYLHDAGLDVFIFDYRGFGRSEGTFSEKAMLADARAALQYVSGRPGVATGRLGLYGYSLGNVASIYLAAEVMEHPAFLIAEAPFASANSLTQSALALPLPARWLTTGRFDNAKRIRGIETSLLLLHGKADDFVRYRDNGRVVFENAPEPKQLLLIDDAKHNDIPQTMGVRDYQRTIVAFIDEALGG